MSHCYDVAIVGAGPSGSAAAFWLAKQGHDVLLVEKKKFPRSKTCGDGLTPRSVKQLRDMGLGSSLDKHHKVDGLRMAAFGKFMDIPWPSHPTLPPTGYVVSRFDLDLAVAQQAERAGATTWYEAEAVDPLLRAGAVGGMVVKRTTSNEITEVNARFVLVADGANSRFGRAMGTSRNKTYPQGMAIRGYFNSERHDDSMMEGHLDLHDREGNNLPGYGWIFPMGDGRVNVGVGLLSTFNQWKSVNTTQLMEAFVATAPPSWGISPDSACGAPTGGRLPMAFSVGPRSGANYLVIGDASGAINPFNGEGIAYAYETGRLAADCIDVALAEDDPRLLHRYSAQLEQNYGLYYKVARVFVHAIGRPEVMKAMVSTGMHSRSLMDWTVRIMNNSLRPDELGPAEMAYKAVSTLLRLMPGR